MNGNYLDWSNYRITFSPNIGQEIGKNIVRCQVMNAGFSMVYFSELAVHRECMATRLYRVSRPYVKVGVSGLYVTLCVLGLY